MRVDRLARKWIKFTNGRGDVPRINFFACCGETSMCDFSLPFRDGL